MDATDRTDRHDRLPDIPVSGEIVTAAPDPGVHYVPPAGVVDLIYRMWISLTAARARQIAIILLTAGLATTLVLAGVALVAHLVIGASAVVSAGGAALAGTGLVAAGYGIVRRYRNRTETTRRGRR